MPGTSGQLTWNDVQRYSDAVLASGLRHLLAQPRLRWGATGIGQAGVYVFSEGDRAAYVGESKLMASRVGQHVDGNSPLMASLCAAGIADPTAHASSRFEIQTVPVSIGRLELEEFAISSLNPTFNRMHRASRSARLFADAELELWLRVQDDCASLLREGAGIAASVPIVAWAELSPPAGSGVYIVRDHDRTLLYIGESDALAERLGTHRAPRSYFSALRRHIGLELLDLAFAPGVTRGFNPTDEAAISGRLALCTVAVVPLSFGRWELERQLVQELRPLLNREHAVHR